MKTFDYYQENDCDQKQLEYFGLSGWELCSVIKLGESNRYVFKRERCPEAKFTIKDVNELLKGAEK